MALSEGNAVRPNAIRRGGRPTRLEAAALGDKILDVATALFLSRGFGATSIEAVASRARISKRTFYHRFRDKAELYTAVVRRLLQHWLPEVEAAFETPGPLDSVLERLAKRMLTLALSPQALALRRLLLAEAERFPELVNIAIEQGATRAIERIAALLEEERRAGRIALDDCRFAATQFQEMVISIPLRRAMGFGAPLTEAERDDWAVKCVALFIGGCRTQGDAGGNRAGD
ncbi:MAG TPA: TetR/AcrR family transcriptional regulator [Stellaceae bacterium]|nr:TetR/AcrR family transcriptional regulator [Stellaceae bacterium]